MPFKKKVYRTRCYGSAPYYSPIIEEKKVVEDGVTKISQDVKYIDICDPTFDPPTPNVDDFNNLERMLDSGVSLTQVNTAVIRNSDPCEIENIINNTKIVEDEN